MKTCFYCKTKIDPFDNGGHILFSRYNEEVHYHKNCYLWNMNGMRNV